jgi:hypothetical protein
MAQDDTVSNEIYQRILDAYSLLPFWLKPEYLSKQQGRQVIFQRADEHQRTVDPGLGSTLHVSNAQRSTGVAIGRTVRNILASEASRWPDPQVWTADIKPSLNAPDMLGIIESTAYGRHGLYYNLWNAAEKGKSVWRALFIPVYKVRKYSMPVYKSEHFALTPEEKGLRNNVKTKENFTIPLGFFKWRREQIIETIAATQSSRTFKESYPITPGEAFISSGRCAFPDTCLDEQEQEFCRPPSMIGEINYVGADQPPELKMHAPTEEEILECPEQHDRFWVWEEPNDNAMVEYYLAADVASGTAKDYSDATVYRIGYGIEPSVQVAEWHGWVNAAHFARIIAAIGYWYHTAEVAVEYMRDGVTTGNELKTSLDYPAIYRWKKMDRLNVHTQNIHWITNHQTRDDAISRMSQHLLDRTIIIRNRHLIEEMRDFGRFDGEEDYKPEGLDSPDDMVMANIIAMAALHQSGKRQEYAELAGMSGDGQKHAHLLPKTPVVFSIHNQFGQSVPVNEVITSLDMGNKLIAKMSKQYGFDLSKQWRVVPVTVSRANTCWSPIWDQSGAENELAVIHGMPGQEIMKNPDAVSRLRELRHLRAKYGEQQFTDDTESSTDYTADVGTVYGDDN